MQQAHVFCSQASADPLFGALSLGSGHTKVPKFQGKCSGGVGAVERWEADTFVIFKGAG